MKVTSLVTKDDRAHGLVLGVMYSPLLVIILVIASLLVSS